jgi:hypothetical protein
LIATADPNRTRVFPLCVVTVIVVLAIVAARPEAQTGGGISATYPGDVGIENHPAVIFTEQFEEGAIAGIVPRWGDAKNPGEMQLVTDVPPGTPAGHALSIPWVGGGVSNGGHLYKVLNPAVTDTIYIRYYIKYPTIGKFAHTGIWVGGFNPASTWPNPQAGVKPNGEHAIWLNGVKVSHLGLGFPQGTWFGGRFMQDPAATTSFEGFRWRSTTALNINWIWLQNYSPDDPAGVSSTILFDHVVVATSYIGCLGSSPPQPPSPPANLRVVKGP